MCQRKKPVAVSGHSHQAHLLAYLALLFYNSTREFEKKEEEKRRKTQNSLEALLKVNMWTILERLQKETYINREAGDRVWLLPLSRAKKINLP